MDEEVKRAFNLSMRMSPSFEMLIWCGMYDKCGEHGE